MGWIILAIVVILVIAIISMYNSLVSSRIKVDNAWSQIDVQLQRRFDLIPNFVETVKGYMQHEKGTLTEVIKLRNIAYNHMSNEEKIKANEHLSNNLNKIIALAEAYPDLKANENFKDLSSQLSRVEDDIANSRKYYNCFIRQYNNKVETFPNNIFAGLLGYKSKTMFEANVNERENVKIKF